MTSWLSPRRVTGSLMDDIGKSCTARIRWRARDCRVRGPRTHAYPPHSVLERDSVRDCVQIRTAGRSYQAPLAPHPFAQFLPAATEPTVEYCSLETFLIGHRLDDRLAFALIGATATPVTALSDPGSGIPRFPYWILILRAAISAGLGWRRWNSRSSTSEQR